ncbi:MAG: biotin--[acetyl-CoA-carboxylase] ligase [Candidatus Sumerlaeia bacterium]|nr:biotin--[acetyl-CoA-carboxylase] ligase [Candidatus Sumerlaeia bacterium]
MAQKLSEPLDLAARAVAAARPHWEVLAHAEIDSTSAEARRLIDAAPGRPPFLVLADLQTSGRGRTGTRWESGAGLSFLGTACARAVDAGPRSLWPLRIAVACAEALELGALLPVGLKWPNDLLVGGRKLGGILMEDLGGGWIAAGVGVNLLQSSEQLPTVPAGFPQPTSLAVELGEMLPPREAVVVALCERLIDAFEHALPAPLALGAFKKRWCSPGARVRERPGERQLSGTAIDIDEEGFLLVRGDDGAIHRVSTPVELADAPRRDATTPVLTVRRSGA